MSNGKGDKRRPSQIDKKEFDKNWDRVFKKGKQNGNKKIKHNNKSNDR